MTRLPQINGRSRRAWNVRGLIEIWKSWYPRLHLIPIEAPTSRRPASSARRNGPLWHGGGIVSTGLALEKRYAQLVIASTYSYSNLAPWGSHPLTDPLLSALGTRVIHDDAAFSRIEKTEFIARREMALRTLRVCWNARSGS